MGAAKSKSSLTIINESCIDVITSQMNQCSSNVKAVQDNTLMGVDIFGKNVQSVTMDQQCTQNIQITNDMIAAMASKIQQQANAKTVSLLPGYSGSANKQNLQNYLSSKITTQTVQQAMANLEAAQINVIGAGGISIGRSNTQTITSVQKALQEVLNNNSVAQGITNDTNQSSSASTDTNPIAQIFAAITDSIWGWIMIFVVFIALIVTGALVLKKLLGSDAPTVVMDSGPPVEEPTQLSVGDDGALLKPDGQPALDDMGTPIYVSAEGASLEGPNGTPQTFNGQPVFVDEKGVKILPDGTPVATARANPSARVSPAQVDVSEEELRAMEQTGAPEAN